MYLHHRPQRKKQQDTLKMLQAAAERRKDYHQLPCIYGTIDTVFEDSFLIKTDSGSNDESREKWAVPGKQPEDPAAHKP